MVQVKEMNDPLVYTGRLELPKWFQFSLTYGTDPDETRYTKGTVSHRRISRNHYGDRDLLWSDHLRLGYLVPTSGSTVTREKYRRSRGPQGNLVWFGVGGRSSSVTPPVVSEPCVFEPRHQVPISGGQNPGRGGVPGTRREEWNPTTEKETTNLDTGSLK